MKGFYRLFVPIILGGHLCSLYAKIDSALQPAEKVLPTMPSKLPLDPEYFAAYKEIIPVAVIGGGPTGIAAAINPARTGYTSVVFLGPKPGGELSEAQTVENWPGLPAMSGEQVMKAFIQQAKGLGVTMVPLSVSLLDVSSWPYKLTLNDGSTVHALTVILAMGSSQKQLGMVNEEFYWGKGLYVCTICDGGYAQGKNTVVIGHSDIAIQRVLQLAQSANHVTLISSKPELTAHKTMQAKLEPLENVTIMYDTKVTGLYGNMDGITSIGISTGNTDTHEYLEDITSVFLSTGLTPNNELVKDILPLDKKTACITLAKESKQATATRLPGIKAAGTVENAQYRQVAAIMGDGTKAGMDALADLAHWGFDSEPLRSLLSKKPYQTPQIPCPAMVSLTSQEELDAALQETEPFFIEVYAPGCTKCNEAAGPLARLMEQHGQNLKVFSLDRTQPWAQKFVASHDIEATPAFLCFEKGTLADRATAIKTLEELTAFITPHLPSRTA